MNFSVRAAAAAAPSTAKAIPHQESRSSQIKNSPMKIIVPGGAKTKNASKKPDTTFQNRFTVQ